MNVELLRKVAKFVVENPSQFTMAKFYCDGRACIATLAVFLNRANGKTLKETMDNETIHLVAWQAAKLLFNETSVLNGLSYQLFYTANWPENFKNAFHAAETEGIRAKVAGEYIHWFINEHETQRATT